MTLPIVTQLLPMASTVIDRLIPDKTLNERFKRELEESLISNAHQINIETIRTNQVSAAHRSIWVAGWRPAIGWSCAGGIFWMVLGNPVANWVLGAFGVDAPLPDLPTELLGELTFAMLGMGALRSFDKLRGTSK